MHMEAVQRYVISLTEQESKALYKEMQSLAGGLFFDRPKLQELYETLEIWAVD